MKLERCVCGKEEGLEFEVDVKSESVSAPSKIVFFVKCGGCGRTGPKSKPGMTTEMFEDAGMKWKEHVNGIKISR